MWGRLYHQNAVGEQPRSEELQVPHQSHSLAAKEPVVYHVSSSTRQRSHIRYLISLRRPTHKFSTATDATTSTTTLRPYPPHQSPTSHPPPPTFIMLFHIATTASPPPTCPSIPPDTTRHSPLACPAAYPGSVHRVFPPKIPHIGACSSTSFPNLLASKAMSDVTRASASARPDGSTWARASRANAT